jgi:DNA-binding MarR family transcriptional regulator
MASAPTQREASSPAAEAWGLIHDLFMSQRVRFMAIAAEFELAPGQLGALKSLDPERPVPMSELADTLHCDASNVTGIVDRLEARGYVERGPAEHDRRVKLLTVTPEGARVRARMAERMSQPPEQIASLPPQDQRALRDILGRALDR